MSMLLKLRDFIKRENVVSSQQLTREFYIDELALQPLLDFWIRKRVIQPVSESRNCQSSCMGCKPNRPVFYQYCN